jgi:hypothetical protein
MNLNIDLPDLTDDQIRQQLADHIDACQFETEPLTEAEADVIIDYARSIQGFPCTFDGLDADGIRSYSEEFGQAEALNMIRAHFPLLDRWQEQIAKLREALPRNADGDFSTAAARFVGYELVSAEDAARSVHAAVVAYFLGKDEYGYPYGGLRPCEGFRYVDGMFWVDPSQPHA